MSKLHSDYTTPEQSKRLLELGVPADSANYLYDNYYLGVDPNDPPIVIYPCYTFKQYDPQYYTPCWSVGRLMEIFAICFDPDFIHFDTYADGINFLQQMMDKFETYAENMDFSKLEE